MGPNTFVIGYQKIKNRSLWLLSKKGINQEEKAMLAINYGRTDNNEFSRDSSNEDDDDILATSNKEKLHQSMEQLLLLPPQQPPNKPSKKKSRKIAVIVVVAAEGQGVENYLRWKFLPMKIYGI